MALRLLRSVAFWQGASFLMLLSCIWANEALDLAHQICGRPATPIDWFGASILSAAVVLIGFVTVAHTYVRQCRALDSFLVVCAHCRKVRVGKSAWTNLEEFLHGRTKTEFSHGICPTCYQEALDEETSRLLTPDPSGEDLPAARSDRPAPAPALTP